MSGLSTPCASLCCRKSSHKIVRLLTYNVSYSERIPFFPMLLQLSVEVFPLYSGVINVVDGILSFIASFLVLTMS